MVVKSRCRAIQFRPSSIRILEIHMGTVTRDVLAEQLAERAEITMVAARDEIRWFFETMAGALGEGDEVRIHGFGAWSVKDRPARVARNPRTGENVKVAARKVVRFAPSSTLSASLRAGGARGRKRSSGTTKAAAAKKTAKK
jgi:DNA-binding protein HU-beta